MADFTLDPSMIYLNHAAVAPWPQQSIKEVIAFAQENGTWGSHNYPQWLEKEDSLRRLLAQLINAPSPEDIALLKSTSEGLSFIAYGLDWRAGDNIVSILQEFPSNRIVWESLHNQGVDLRLLDLTQSADPEQDLIALCDERTRLLSISSVQYASGRKMRLDVVGDFCHSEGILYLIDAIQSLGATPFDVERYRADVVVADGHKWMLGPEGLALFYCRQSLREHLKLNEYGWHMVEAVGEFDRFDWQPASSSRRFECGSPNMLGVQALHASLSLLINQGIESVANSIHKLTQCIIDHVDELDFQLLTPRAPEQRAGIVTFSLPEQDNKIIYQSLMNYNVMCAHRGGGIRFSPHYYITEAQISEAFRRLQELLYKRNISS
jgi:selenocysteine lyase/cysteine desulfurase